LRRWESGQPKDILIISTDITVYKAAELEMARLAAAQAALHERDQLLATVSHDLKTPLTAIRGQADILLRDIEQNGELDTNRARKGLELLRTAATRMGTWIDDLLETARLEAGRSVELHRQPMDLVALAWQAVAEHQRNTQRHRLRVRTHESRLIGVWDPVRLRRVLDNLLSNAVKFSPDGGEVVVSVELNGDTARLSVSDNGVGIPADDLPQIFERFGRARNVVGRIGGTGIGLHGVCQIVQDHGGRIDVESEEGQGTTFTLELPLLTDQIESGRRARQDAS
jgi:signal transduction histidine kinase